ncbi:MAG: mechanosensitive ion channel family protein [Oscillospiraceae bacterium]|nr:mechanosensitive ion channel family protein [Oscillospiraceae bacterium]
MKKNRTIIGIVVAVVLIVLLLNLGRLPIASQFKDAFLELKRDHFLLEGNGHITIAHLMTLLLAICIIWLCYIVIKFILFAIGKKTARAQTVTALLTGAAKYICVIAGIVWGLSILGVNTTAVLAGVGILGLILGFGAQSLIEDIITGIFIIFEGQYSIGDIIVLDDFRGVVRDIGVRTTSIEDAGGNVKVVNNSDIRNFQNRSRNTSLAMVEVSVAYNTDVKRMERIIREAMPAMYEEHKDLYLHVPYYQGVLSLGDSGVVIRVIAEVKEENIFIAQRQLTRDIWVLFGEKGIEIPFPQVVVHQGD